MKSHWLPRQTLFLLMASPLVAMAAKGMSPAQEALERAEIGNLISRTIFAYDRKDGPAVSACFTAQGELRIETRPAPVVAHGTDAISKFVNSNPTATSASAQPAAAASPDSASPPPPPPVASHHIITSDYTVLVDATHAKHYGYWALATGSMGKIQIVQLGGYDDDLQKVGGHWLFTVHRITFGPVNPQ